MIVRIAIPAAATVWKAYARDPRRTTPKCCASSTREAEGVRFELTRPFGLPVFKTGAINRSATPPGPDRICDRKFITPLVHYSK